MLFIREYNAKSLDRSSVSMIDKYNTRLGKVSQLLVNLSSLIENLLSLIRSIRNTLGQCKQRVYDNLNQAKEVISGNDITGTEGTIAAIEDALKAGDVAIAQAEATLQDVQQEMECDEGTPTSQVNDCGEECNETPTAEVVEDCIYCGYSNTFSSGSDNSCAVCAHGDCVVDYMCNEEVGLDKEDLEPIAGCNHNVSFLPLCNEEYGYNENCKEQSCIHGVNGPTPPADCPFTCNHSSPCQETPMPANCTYSCVDSGCNYAGNDCAYGTICNESCDQTESCNQFDCGEFDCGEPCGETCHMTDDEDCSEDCSEGSCGECSESDDGPCNQYDCSEYDCGEPCGESCGLL